MSQVDGQLFDSVSGDVMTAINGVGNREVGNVGFNLAELYLNGKIGTHFHFEVLDGEEYCIFLKRSSATENLSRSEESLKSRVTAADRTGLADTSKHHI